MNFFYQEIEVDSLKEKLILPTRFGGDNRELLTSIQNHGILNPIHVWKNAHETIILDGHCRLEMAKLFKFEKIPCFTHEADIIDIEKALILSLELNRFSRTFNLIEKAYLIEFAHFQLGNNKVPKQFFSLLGINNNLKIIQNYRRLLRLPELILKYIVNNNLSLSTALGFMHFPQEDLEKIANRLFVLPLNQNKLSEHLALLFDLSRREERRAIEILDEALSKLSSRSSAAQKEQDLRFFLKQKRNPHYENKLMQFKQRIQELAVPESVELQPSPFFEEDTITINMTLKSSEDLEKLRTTIQDDRILDLLKP